MLAATGEPVEGGGGGGPEDPRVLEAGLLEGRIRVSYLANRS